MNIYLYFCTIQGDKGTLIFFINKLLQKKYCPEFSLLHRVAQRLTIYIARIKKLSVVTKWQTVGGILCLIKNNLTI